VIRQTKTIQISTYNYNLLAESIYLPDFFCQMLKTSKLAKLSPRQTFLLYSTLKLIESGCQQQSLIIILVSHQLGKSSKGLHRYEKLANGTWYTLHYGRFHYGFIQSSISSPILLNA